MTVTEVKVYTEGSKEEVVNSHGGEVREGTFEQVAFELCLER